MSTLRLDRAAWPFLAALLIAAVARLLYPFDGLFGQDAFAYFRFARAIWPHLLHGAPLPQLFWPRGYPIVVAALLPLTGGGPFAGQLVSALALAWTAAASLLLTAELDRRGGGVPDGLAPAVAGFSVAGSGIVLRSSQVVMADGLAIACAATALWCFARHLRERRGGWLVAAAVAVAFGAVTRWQIGLLALPLGAAAALDARARPAPLAWGAWILAGLAGLAVVIPQLWSAHGVPYALEQHEWLQRWSPLNAFRRDFVTREGPTHHLLPIGVFYLARTGWPDALFPTIAVLALLGALALVRARRAVELALLVGWPAINWAFISGIPYENPRFLWPALPSLGALAGFGARALAARFPARRLLLALALVASLAAGLALAAREHGRTVARKNADRTLVDWVDARVPPGTTLLTHGGGMMIEHYGRTRVHETFLLTPAELPSLLARECPCFELENPTEIEAEQRGPGPARFFAALQAQAGLTPVASRGPLILYRVGAVR
ncbi:MAG TPA: glycosyltransferase family 39 protein [Polyangia bacterium]